MPSIYDIKNEFLTLWAILEDELTDDETLLGAFETATEDLAVKLENCCKYIANEKAAIKGLKDEEARLKARRQAKENAVERLKKLMQDALDASGNKKLPCGTFTVYLQKNPEKLVMDETDLAKIPQQYLKQKDPEIDTAKIKDDILSGVDVKGIGHIVQDESLRIR